MSSLIHPNSASTPGPNLGPGPHLGAHQGPGSGPLPDPTQQPDSDSELNVAEYLAMIRRHWKLVALLALVAVVSAVVHYSITPKEYMARATLQIERRSLSSPLVNAQNAWFENLYNPEFYPTQYKLLESRGLAERVVRNLELADDPAFNPGAALRRSKEAGIATTAEDDDALVGRLADRLRGGLAVQPVRSTQLVELSYRSRTPEFAARAANGFAEAFIDLGIEDRYATAGKASTFIAAQIETLKQEIQDKEAQLQAFSRRSDIVALDPESNVLLQRLQTLNQDYMGAKKDRIEKESRYQEVLSTPKETVADSLSEGLVSDMRAEQLKLEQEYETKLKTYKPEYPAMVDLRAKIDKLRRDIETLIAEKVTQAKGSASAEFQTARRQERALESELTGMKGEAMDQSSAAVEYTNLKVEVETRRELLDELLRKQSETEVTVRLQDTRDSNIKIIDRALVPGGPFRPSLQQGPLLRPLPRPAAGRRLCPADRVPRPLGEDPRGGGAPARPADPRRHPRRQRGRPRLRLRPGRLRLRPGAGGGRRGRSGRGERNGRRGRRERRRTAGSHAPRLAGRLAGEEEGHARGLGADRAGAPRAAAHADLRGLPLAAHRPPAVERRGAQGDRRHLGRGRRGQDHHRHQPGGGHGPARPPGAAGRRRPAQAAPAPGVPGLNRAGLVNCLTLGGAEADVVQRTDVPNLWLIPSGPIPPNPSELLASDRMREWTRQQRARFDMVIFDTPPVLAVTDATLVGVLVDGVVLTLRTGKVTREDARACRDRLRLADIRILGVVLNRHRAGQGLLGKRYYAYETYGAAERDREARGRLGAA